MGFARGAAAALCALVLLAFAASEARACACCSERGQRGIGTAPYETHVRTLFERLVFSAEADLAIGAADSEGIDEPTSSYDFAVKADETRFVFSFRSRRGKTGTLTLVLPSTVSIFVIDPRTDTSDGGLGPTLYKEYTLTAKAEGTGVFAAGIDGKTQIALIIHGQGRGCTEAEDFHAWTITVKGAKAQYAFIGALNPPNP